MAAQRLSLSTAVGVVVGLALWSELSGSEPARDSPPAPTPSGQADASPDRSARRPGQPYGRRDSRPPHAPRVPASPPRLEIPAIGIRAHVSPLGTTNTGALEVPRNWSVVGRWNGGSHPGRPGVAVLVGHVDSRKRPAVFHDLGKLRRGDLIRYERRDGSVARFMVARKERVPKAGFPTARVYGETKVPSLRLITCTGSFDWSRGHYRDNLIVYADSIGRR